jgi:uncharacterized protein (DUF433 family)
VIRGKVIELSEETGLPEGQEVSVQIEPVVATKPGADGSPPPWLARLEVNPAVRPGKLVIKGTALLADNLVLHLEEGWSDENLLRTYPQLTREDVAALREYAKLPREMRRSFGAWAEDAEELDQFLEWNRQQRKVGRRGIDD